MREIIIDVKDFRKVYGKVKAVDGISFEVQRGSIFGLIGPNGAGKSTTIEAMAGLNKRDAGEIRILGFDPDIGMEEIKKNIGVQLQNPSLFPLLTAIETVSLFASFYLNPLLPEDALRRVGLEKKLKQTVKTLSGGERHRLAIALALVSNGDLIFLDEPTTGLDPNARRQLWDVILNLKKRGSTVVLTTHYMEEAEKLCDEIAIIDYGKIIAQGAPKRLIGESFKEQALEFEDPGFSDYEREGLKELKTVSKVIFDEKQGSIIIYSKEVTQTISQLNKYCNKLSKQIGNLTIRSATLEDLFIKLTGRGIANENL